MTHYFIHAETADKPVLRFFSHWFEVVDFLNLMGWKNGKSEEAIVEIYHKMEDEDIKEKM